MRVIIVLLSLLASSFRGSDGKAYLLRPRTDAFIQGHSFKDYNRSQTLEVKEKYDSQVNVKLIRRSFMEIDVSQVCDKSVIDVAEMQLMIKKSGEGAVIQLCPAEPYTEKFHNKALSWNRQPKFDCQNTLGKIEYNKGMTNMTWDVAKYLQKQLNGGKTKVAFAIIAAKPHIYTSFHSMNSKAGWSKRPALKVKAFVPPFDEAKFQPVLSSSRLQHPLASHAAVSNGKFQGYGKEHFQLIDNKYMQVQAQGLHHRTVIRHNSVWSITTKSKRSLVASIRLPKPSYPTRETTLFQIEGLGKTGTLLRVGWERSKEHLKDHLWATVRTSLKTKEVIKFPLFPRPTETFKIEISIEKRKLSIKYNDEPHLPLELSKELESYDVSDWKDAKHIVFEAGILLNHGEGPASVQFEMLEITSDFLEGET